MPSYGCLPFATVSLLLAVSCSVIIGPLAGASQLVSLPGCPSSCGNLTIPYPFGIGTGCAREGFKLTCNDSFSPPKTFLDGGVTDFDFVEEMEVSNISLNSAEATVYNGRAYDCYNGSNIDYNDRAWLRDDSPYTFSSVRNKFTVLGCDTYAFIHGERGCITSCSGFSQAVNGSCDGVGCCQISIREGLKYYQISLSRLDSHTHGWDFNPCRYAFLVEQDWFTFRSADITNESIYRYNVSLVPVVLDWVAGSESCEVARTNTSTFACRSEQSECYNSTGSATGYLCKCSSGYQGNPYLVGGCQDIDECKSPETYPCKGVCTNHPGGYSCSCPIGTYGDPKIHCFLDNKHARMITGTSIGISCGLGALLSAICAVGIRNMLRKKRIAKRRLKHSKENYDILLQRQIFYRKTNTGVDRIKFFTLKDLEKATNRFDNSKIVGTGGYGTVYKGLLDLDVVAIKRCNVNTAIEREQFINEVILLSHITHKNVVKLLGCCFETEVPLLVYEFISNGTLSDNLHNPCWEHCLSWYDRVRIAQEISSALVYMHSETYISIFHRDIKSANILLDDRLAAKISDFGTSRSIAMEQTHASTRVMGTLGYMDPEYFQTGQLTEKSDVYSLGVILVEMLTGEIPTPTPNNEDDRNLVIRFISAVKDNRLLNVVAASIAEDANIEELEVVGKLAIACLNIRGEDRPTMKEVQRVLEGLVDKKRRKKQNPSSVGNLREMRGLLQEMSSFYLGDGCVTTSGSAKSFPDKGVELTLPR